jgi:hypothetical protein
MSSRRRTRRRFGLFVEGANYALGRHDELSDLWTDLCAHFGVAGADVDVHGFSKGDILAMAPPAGVTLPVKRPLDALVRIAHRQKAFDVLIVCFDATPPNDLVPNCLPGEVEFVLGHFAASTILPDQFRRDAERLCRHYRSQPKPEPRAPGRPPRSSVDVLYMDPQFEALVLADVAPWLGVFGLRRRPKDWPSMRWTGRLDDLLVRVVEAGRRHGQAPRHLHAGDVRAHKHAWAREAVRCASRRVWETQIATRLEVLLG